MNFKINKKETKIVGNSDNPKNTKNKAIKSLKKSEDFIYSNSDNEVSIIGDVFEVSLSYMAILLKLLQIFTKDELIYLLNFASKNTNTHKIEEIKEEELDKFSLFVKTVNNRLGSDDLSIK